MRIAINGFGRIGRMILRAYLEKKDLPFEIVAINDLGDLKEHLHLFQYDSVHGRLNREITVEGNSFDLGRGPIAYCSVRDPSDLPWKELNIDLVYECSGRFTKREQAQKHLEAGAKRVLISAPATDPDLTVVYGVNHDQITKDHLIISNASCTTNCLAPMAMVLHHKIGIESGYMTTIHSYTGDQRLIDTSHQDLRRARAAALSMIPSSTGAAKAVGLVLPELKGRLDGTAIRVPTPNVSVVDLTFWASRPTTIKEMQNSLIEASQTHLKGILGVTDQPLVSCDFNHDDRSCIVDLPQTQVVQGRFCRILAWYDNEWGFSNRMLDVAGFIRG